MTYTKIVIVSVNGVNKVCYSKEGTSKRYITYKNKKMSLTKYKALKTKKAKKTNKAKK